MKRTTTFRILRRASGALLLASALWLGGCVKQEELTPPVAPPGSGSVIRISSAIDAAARTKGAVENDQELSSIRFLRKDVAGAVAPTTYAGITPIIGSRSAGGAITFANPPVYNLNNDNAWFVAYWPQPTVSESDPVKWGIDGKTDILLSDPYNAGTFTHPLNGTGGEKGEPMRFRHKLSQLEVRCVADEGSTLADVQKGWGKVTGIKVSSSTEGWFGYNAPDVLDFSATKHSLALPAPNYTDDFPAAGVELTKTATTVAAGMVSPTPDGSSSKNIGIDVYTSLYPEGVKIEVPSDKGLLMGKRHIVTLSFKAYQKKIEVLSTRITDWGNGYMADGELKDPNGTYEPKVGDYYYTDGTVSTDKAASKTVAGMVFWTDPENPMHFKVVQLQEPPASWNGGTNTVGRLLWSTARFDVGTEKYAGIRTGGGNIDHVARVSGKANRKILGDWIADKSVNTSNYSITNFPAFRWCDSQTVGGTDWFLPAMTELQYLYCAYNGSAPTRWTSSTTNAPAPNATNQAAWNNRMKAAGGTIFDYYQAYWTSTEYLSTMSWTVRMGDGQTVSTCFKDDLYGVRCIKEITQPQ